MIDRDFLVAALTPINGKYFHIEDLEAYADKVAAHGRALTIDDAGGQPAAFVLYYDDGPTVYVTMTWTDPEHRRLGLMHSLMSRLITQTTKDIRLEVHRDNPARRVYEGLGFVEAGASGDKVAMVRHRRIAIMQPYTFPYLGYFQLVHAVDTFVFYDDVAFIPRGWINRNAILGAHGRHPFSIPVARGSQNALIKDVRLAVDSRWLDKFRATLAMSYARAPHREVVIDLALSVIERHSGGYIAELAIDSIAAVFARLDLPFTAVRSSKAFPETRGMEKCARLAAITRELGATHYVNAPGGRELYSPQDFATRGVSLGFLESHLSAYSQRGQTFEPGLSIIDVLMYNDVHQVRGMLSDFTIDWS